MDQFSELEGSRVAEQQSRVGNISVDDEEPKTSERRKFTQRNKLVVHAIKVLAVDCVSMEKTVGSLNKSKRIFKLR